MRLSLWMLIIPAAPCVAATSAKRVDGHWCLENPALRVAVDEVSGAITVTDKRINYTWRPATTVPLSTASLTVPRLDGSRAVDGKIDDWPASPSFELTPAMTADAREVDGPRDLSAQGWAAWDDEALWLAVRVTDDKRVFARRSDEQWWERDSVEFWVNGRQVGIAPDPEDPVASVPGRAAPIAGRIATVESPDGYVIEARFPWSALPGPAELAPGSSFRFALGVNDADDASGRQCQLYYPASWVHSQPATFALATLADAAGRAPLVAQAEPAEKMRSIVPAGESLEMDVEVSTRDGQLVPAKLKITVPAEGADVIVDVDVPDRAQSYGALGVLPTLVLDSDRGFVLAARYADGILIDTNDMDWRGRSFDTASSIDMPWIGLTDMTKGYLLLADTPDDASIRLEPARVGEKDLLAPALYWTDSKGQFRYPRRFQWSFVDRGGYVAICKRYRDYAKQAGFLKTLGEKEKAKPQLALLAGAPDFWGVPGLQWCREAKAAGIDRALINGRWPKEDTEAMEGLGYLVGEYDNYVDIQDGPMGESNHAPLPASAAKRSDGEPIQGWVTWDKKTTYMKLCAALAVQAAKLEIPPVLEKHPYNARFLDVSTASGLLECYDPVHPLTRTGWREANEALAKYVSGLGLVLGGEHGRWYGVPYYDYWEGMQSGGDYSWPAGHVGVNIPQTRDEIGAGYLKYGIGHYYRVPLWELCFHDCVVSTWYWGDSTGHLYKAAPEIADKKDAFNILYGTIPLYWVSQPYSFNWSVPELRARLLQSYRNTCKLHEQVFGQEMLSHEFVNEDHTVQRTRFANGVQVTVNFGEQPYRIDHVAATAMQTFTLGTNDFFATGPNFLQYRAIEGGRKITLIRAPGYAFCDPGGKQHDFGIADTSVPVTLREAAKGVLLVNVGGSEQPTSVTLRPDGLVPDWDAKSTRLYRLSADLPGRQAGAQRVAEVTIEKRGHVLITQVPGGAFQLLSGPAVKLPDLSIVRQAVSVAETPGRPATAKVSLRALVKNAGGVASTARVHVELDTVAGPLELASGKAALPPGQQKEVTVSREVTGFAGRYAAHVTVADEEGREELVSLDNSADATIDFPADYAAWPHKFQVTARSGGVVRHDEPVVLHVDLARQFGADAYDPASVRVLDITAGGVRPEGIVPSQFDPTENGEGDLLWVLTGDTPAGAERRFLIVARDRVPDAPAGPMGDLTWDDAAKAVRTPVYRAVFKDGVICGLYALGGKRPEASFIRSLGVSSEVTGWVDEIGEVTSFQVVHQGPVRIVVRVTKSLRGGYEITKTYDFCRDYFTVDMASNKPISVASRAYYLRPCNYVDDKGNTAEVDGRGDAENVSDRNPDPKWYACYSDEWAQSCVALSPFSGLTYWDAGAWGGIGFGTAATEGVRLAYVIHPGQPDASFARADYERLTQPVQLAIAE
jgi:hypothetical protein